MAYSEPHYTKDLDLWVDPSPANAAAVFRALQQFGAPLDSITPEDFTKPDLVYQVGIEPVRIDILMSIPGLHFVDAWERRVNFDVDGVSAHFISLADLILSKERTGRKADREQLRRLRKAAAKKR